ncbi:MAG: hypothetical protein AAF757_08385 [Cyanobacteria bacterium P01_D01_bin.116]
MAFEDTEYCELEVISYFILDFGLEVRSKNLTFNLYLTFNLLLGWISLSVRFFFVILKNPSAREKLSKNPNQEYSSQPQKTSDFQKTLALEKTGLQIPIKNILPKDKNFRFSKKP